MLPLVVPCAYIVSELSFNTALETTLSLKLFASFVFTIWVCNVSISVLAFVKLFLIAVISKSYVIIFSCYWIMPSTLPGTILLAIY